jgi:NADH-quinone oxidoreductase subunit K
MWLGCILFYISMLGLSMLRRNVIITLMSIELMLLGVVEILTLYSSIIVDEHGEVFSIFILTIAAAETATGLAILVNYYKMNEDIGILDIKRLKG